MTMDRAAQVLADPQVVVPIVAVHGLQVPWGKVVIDGCRSCQPGGYQACCALSRWCWSQSGSPPWPTAPGFASAPPPNLTRERLLKPGPYGPQPDPSPYRNSSGDPAWTNVTPDRLALGTAAGGNPQQRTSLALAAHARQGTVAASGKPATKER